MKQKTKRNQNKKNIKVRHSKEEINTDFYYKISIFFQIFLTSIIKKQYQYRL